MFKTLKNAWRVPDLRNKILFTLLIIVIFRLGANIVVPYVDPNIAASFARSYGTTTLGFLSVMSGNALQNATLFALSVSPYITASIVMQLLAIAIPALERLSKDEDGKKKINKITRYVTIGLAVLTAFGYTSLIDAGDKQTGSWMVNHTEHRVWKYFVMIFCFCAGAAIIMWLADKINEKGIGNGISIILFANIISSIPTLIKQICAWVNPQYALTNGLGSFSTDFTKTLDPVGLTVAILAVLLIAGLVVLSVWFTNSERRIPIQYAKRVVGRKMYGGQGTNLPLKMNMAGVMPIIFASSIVTIPGTLLPLVQNFIKIDENTGIGWFVKTYLVQGTWTYIVLYLILLVAFSYFYIMISFNPVEVANNIRNQGGAVPGIRPGKPTSDYIKKILNRITLIGAIFLAVIACLPMFGSLIAPTAFGTFAFSGSSMLIIIGVALETMHDIEAQLTMRNYKGFLD